MCKYSQQSKTKLFPPIKVSDDGGVLTTMSPRAYVGQVDIGGLDFPLPILPLVVAPMGHRHAFSVDKFRAAVESALKAKEARKNITVNMTVHS